MRTSTILKLSSLALLAVSSSFNSASAQNSSGACGTGTFCVESNDFLATVTSFRISTNNIYKQKIIDVTVRFQNKTDRAVVLGYVDHSGLATDDRGNRSIPWGPNAYRGIGLVAGTTFDPKLVLRSGGSGDAQFELVQQGTPQITGVTYMLDITVAQIMPAGANQFTLGGEFPLHFEGLANGSASAIPNLAATANAADAFASLKGIFGKKKHVQDAANIANNAVNTVAAANAATNSVAPKSGPPTGSAGTIAPQPVAAPAAAPASNAAQTHTATAANAPSVSHQSNTSTAQSQSAEPWSPTSDASAEKVESGDPLKLPEVAKMPDVVGVRLGMSEQQALQILRGQYPHGRFQEIPASGIFPTNPKADYGFNILPTDVIATDVVVSLTAPPSQQVVWRIVRNTRKIHTTHANVLAALRQKYGKESLAGAENGSIVTDDNSIGMLFWLFDEHGGRPLMPSPQVFGSANLIGIPCGAMAGSGGVLSDVGPRILMEENKSQDWCSSVVGILVTLDPTEIVERTTTNMVDMRLAARTANAYVAWKRNVDAKARAAELEQSKKNKPVF